jgi:hypothetical protein
MRVLDRRDREAALPRHGDEALDQRGLATALMTDNGCDLHDAPDYPDPD